MQATFDRPQMNVFFMGVHYRLWVGVWEAQLSASWWLWVNPASLQPSLGADTWENMPAQPKTPQ
jgi:hypothetical protein